MEVSDVVEGACHCGTVQFIAKLTDGLEKPRRCNCSLCRMRGAVVATVLVGDLKVTSGDDCLTEYRFNTREARHYFCSKCGIYTHHQRRSNPTQLSVNVACIRGISPFDFVRLPVYDGITHHNDREGGPSYRVAGYLDYSNVG